MLRQSPSKRILFLRSTCDNAQLRRPAVSRSLRKKGADIPRNSSRKKEGAAKPQPKAENLEFENPEGRTLKPQVAEESRYWSEVSGANGPPLPVGVRPSETDERRLTLELLCDVQPALAEQSALPRKILATLGDPPGEQCEKYGGKKQRRVTSPRLPIKVRSPSPLSPDSSNS